MTALRPPVGHCVIAQKSIAVQDRLNAVSAHHVARNKLAIVIEADNVFNRAVIGELDVVH